MVKATIQTRDIYRRRAGDRERVHAGTEVVRSASCPKHKTITSRFEGVNENGWIFRCKGTDLHGDFEHTFVAEPAS